MNLKIHSIPVKTATIILLGLSIIMAGSYYFISSKSREIAYDEHHKATREILSISSKNINQYVDNSLNAIEYVAKDPLAIKALKIGDRKSLEEFSQLADIVQKSRAWAFSGISIFDMNCILKAGDESVASALNKDFSYRDYCKDVKSKKDSVYSGAVLSVTTGTVVFTVATPVTSNNEMIGFVVAGINLDPMFDRLPVKGGEDYYFIVVGKLGNILLDSREGTVRKNILVPVDPNRIGGKVFAMVKSGNSGDILEMSDEFGEMHLVGFDVSDKHQITTIIGEPIKIVQEFGDYLSNLTLSVLLAMLFSSILFIAWIALILAKRLNRITETVYRISKGDFTVKIDSRDLNSKDEVGDLSRAFERVVVSLKLAMREQLPSQEEKNIK